MDWIISRWNTLNNLAENIVLQIQLIIAVRLLWLTYDLLFSQTTNEVNTVYKTIFRKSAEKQIMEKLKEKCFYLNHQSKDWESIKIHYLGHKFQNETFQSGWYMVFCALVIRLQHRVVFIDWFCKGRPKRLN